MSKNITLLGASYSAVPAITLPQTGGGTARFDDATVTTATAADVASGKVFVASDGTITTGTASGGGGSSSWTLVASTSYQVSTTSTSAASLGSFNTGTNDIYTSDEVLFVRIRDTAGKRNNYFYGSDTYIYNKYPFEGGNSNISSVGMSCVLKVNSSGKYIIKYYAASNCYGIYANSVATNGIIGIYSRYNSSNSGTIDGTYSVEVYLLAPPTNAPIFT